MSKFKYVVLLLILNTITLLLGQKNSVIKLEIGSNILINLNTLVLNTNNSALTYQINAPELPCLIFNSKNEIKNLIALDSIDFSEINFSTSTGLNKITNNGLVLSTDTSYYIESFSPDSFFPQVNFKKLNYSNFRNEQKYTYHLYPIKYLERTKTVRVYTRFSIETKSTEQNQYKYTSKLDGGDLLIVYRSISEETIRPFALWKQQKGINVHFLKLNASHSSPELIKSDIQNFYDSIPTILYISLIGEHTEIPSYLYKQFLNDDYYSDTYYSFLNGNDFIPDVFVGRFSGSETEIQNAIERSITYEKYLNQNSQEQKVFLVGSDVTTTNGDDGEEDWEHLRKIGTELQDSLNYQLTELYDGDQGLGDSPNDPTLQDMKDAFNEGQGLFFYTGHGDFSHFVTGNFFTMHVTQLENTDNMPVVFSAACNNGKHINLYCMAEAFTTAQRNNKNVGAIAFTGSSILMSWAPPMQTQDEIAQIIASKDSTRTSVGAIFYNAQMSMLEHYPTVYGEEVMQTWILFGDPTLSVRTKLIDEIKIQTDHFISASTDQLSINININNANVTLTQNNQVIAKTISSNGKANFQSLNLSVDPITIVATKPNHKTAIQTIKVVDTNSERPFVVFPNPTNEYIRIVSAEKVLKATLVDVKGNIILTDELINSEQIINLKTLSAGIYILQLHTSEKIYSHKILKTNEN